MIVEWITGSRISDGIVTDLLSLITEIHLCLTAALLRRSLRIQRMRRTGINGLVMCLYCANENKNMNKRKTDAE